MGLDPYSALIKWGSIALGCVLVFGAIFYAGARYKQQEWDAAVMRQATKTAADVVASAINSADKSTQYIEKAGKTKTIVKTIEKKVVEYVPTTCDIGAGFEFVWDDVSRMRDDANDGLRTADASAIDSSPAAGRRLTLAEVIRAYHYAIAEWRAERERYRALSEWVVSDYQLKLQHRKDQ